ncbi:hypothetical protein ACHAWX_000075 [Stephanocyclus meneghinianus]
MSERVIYGGGNHVRFLYASVPERKNRGHAASDSELVSFWSGWSEVGESLVADCNKFSCKFSLCRQDEAAIYFVCKEEAGPGCMNWSATNVGALQVCVK